MNDLDSDSIARRDFVKVVGLGVFGLFLPRWTRVAWKQKPITFMIPWNYELALLDQSGKEVSGSGYKRVRGVWSDFSPPVKEAFNGRLVTESRRTLNFAPSLGHWGDINSLNIMDKKGNVLFNGVFPSTCAVPLGFSVQFNPGDINIYSDGSSSWDKKIPTNSRELCTI